MPPGADTRFDVPRADAQFDIIVIGAGAAGLSFTAVAAQLGLRVALVERARMGGDCLNFGCVPSKALLAAAHAAIAAREAGKFGVRLPPPRIDWDGVRAHVRSAIATLAPMDSEARFASFGAEVLRGEARFVAAETIAVNGRRLRARRFVIAAGSRPAIPPITGLDQVPYLTHLDIFDLAQAPGHLLIVGGGPVGLEMAQAHAGLGVRVTLVQAQTIAPKEEPELVDALRDSLRALGVTLVENTRVAAAEVLSEQPDGGQLDGGQPGVALVLADGRRLVGTHLLIAAGRLANIEALDLDKAGIRAGPRGVATDRGLRSLTNRRVFAAGDIADPAGIGPRYFTHVGSYHAAILVRRLAFRLPARLRYASLPRVTFTAPELAQVGLTEAEARAAGHAVTVLAWKLANNDRAVTEAETTGAIKLIVARNRVIGASILAPHAGEMINQWTLAIDQRTKLSILAGLIVPYPTRAEIGKRAASAGFAMTLFSRQMKTLVRWLFRLS